MGHCAGDGVVHHIQACVAVHDYVLRLCPHDVRHHLLRFHQPVQHAVIAHVHAFHACQVALGIQDVKDIHPHIQLGYRGLPPGHIQLQSLSFRILIFFLQLCLQSQQFLFAQFLICSHTFLHPMLFHFTHDYAIVRETGSSSELVRLRFQRPIPVSLYTIMHLHYHTTRPANAQEPI